MSPTRANFCLGRRLTACYYLLGRLRAGLRVHLLCHSFHTEMNLEWVRELPNARMFLTRSSAAVTSPSIPAKLKRPAKHKPIGGGEAGLAGKLGPATLTDNCRDKHSDNDLRRSSTRVQSRSSIGWYSLDVSHVFSRLLAVFRGGGVSCRLASDPVAERTLWSMKRQVRR